MVDWQIEALRAEMRLWLCVVVWVLLGADRWPVMLPLTLWTAGALAWLIAEREIFAVPKKEGR